MFALARYDRNYDVRDRGRMLQQLLVGVVPSIGAADAREVGGVVLRRAQVRVVLFEGKEIAPSAHDDAAAARRGHQLGTLGLVLGRDVPHARLLPDWLEHGVESSLRYSPDEAPSTASAVTAIGHLAIPRPGVGSGGHSTPIVVLTPAGSGGPSPAGSVPNKAGFTDLDQFYASSSEEEEEEEDEEGEEESEDGEDEEDEEGNGDGEKSDEESDRHSGFEGVQGAGPPRTSEEDEVKDEYGSDVEEGSSLIGPVGFR